MFEQRSSSHYATTVMRIGMRYALPRSSRLLYSYSETQRGGMRFTILCPFCFKGTIRYVTIEKYFETRSLVLSQLEKANLSALEGFSVISTGKLGFP